MSRLEPGVKKLGQRVKSPGKIAGADTFDAPANAAQPDADRTGFIECYSAEFRAGDTNDADAYAKLLMATFDFEIPAYAAPEAFAASTKVFFLPDVTVSGTQGTASRFTRTVRTIASRGTDQILVVCYREGYFDMTTGGRTQRVAAGELAFIDLSHEVTVQTPQVDNVSLAVSRRKLEAMVPFLDGANGYVRPVDALSKLLRGMMEDIVDFGATMPVVDARGIADATLRLVAACLEPLSLQPAETGRKTVTLVAIKAFIEQHLLDPALGPQMLLHAFGTTRSALYRLFEPLGGVTAYIAQRKLNYAFRLLSDTRQPRGRISKLAADLGFSHPSAFSRAFKETFGLSPKAVQAMARQLREQDAPLKVPSELMQYLRPIAAA